MIYLFLIWCLLGYLSWKASVYLITMVDGTPISRGDTFKWMPIIIIGGLFSVCYVVVVFFDEYADEIEWFKEDFYPAKKKEEEK